ncbi:hypothetical protein GCM10011611_58760 [Aliidongia dinghuensis]|uniref:Uncharacterized protein n=1 Tax=Aliidongia dinghuensis TaxID=1867774 RepID=A0A8J3E6H1_9PROT|nr:hypothetical protein GCM10011611_58760 [Aliidongia dinghuensis]
MAVAISQSAKTIASTLSQAAARRGPPRPAPARPDKGGNDREESEARLEPGEPVGVGPVVGVRPEPDDRRRREPERTYDKAARPKAPSPPRRAQGEAGICVIK